LSTNLTPEQRVLRARIAAHARWSRDRDRRANAERAQAGLLARFRREILAEQPDLTEPELTRLAESRRREHMTRLAYLSSKRRSSTRGGEAA
jgi:hypothetical protein